MRRAATAARVLRPACSTRRPASALLQLGSGAPGPRRWAAVGRLLPPASPWGRPFSTEAAVAEPAAEAEGSLPSSVYEALGLLALAEGDPAAFAARAAAARLSGAEIDER